MRQGCCIQAILRLISRKKTFKYVILVFKGEFSDIIIDYRGTFSNAILFRQIN